MLFCEQEVQFFGMHKNSRKIYINSDLNFVEYNLIIILNSVLLAKPRVRGPDNQKLSGISNN